MLGCVNLYPSPPESCTFQFCPVDRFPPVPILYKLYSIIQMLVDHSIRLCATSMNSKIACNIIFGLAVARCTSFFLLLYRNREVQNALIVLSSPTAHYITMPTGSVLEAQDMQWVVPMVPALEGVYVAHENAITFMTDWAKALG